jgi:hypothetical protein
VFLARTELCIGPLFVWRNVLSLENERMKTIVLISRVCSTAPEPASNSLTILSDDADASRWLSGEKATALAESLWPSRIYNAAHEPVSHGLTNGYTMPT